MKIGLSGFLLLLGTSASMGDEAAPLHWLSLSANAVEVAIAPQPAGRTLLQLPALDFVFRMDPQCADDFAPRSLSLNVADSRKSLPIAALLDGDAYPEVKLTVPAGQLAPIAIQGFCSGAGSESQPGPEDLNADSHLTVPAALSAHASLLCASESRQDITYASATLDVKLICSRPTESAE